MIRTEVKIALGGGDIAKWAAQHISVHGLDPNLNVGEGIFIVGSNMLVYVDRNERTGKRSHPYLDPDSYIEFMLAGGSWSNGLDYDDPRQLCSRALDALLTALGNPRPTKIRIEVDHR